MIRLISKIGESLSVHELLDSTLKASFVVERIVQQFALRRRKAHVIISGLQGIKIGRSTQAMSLRVREGKKYSSKSVSLPMAFILPKFDLV